MVDLVLVDESETPTLGVRSVVPLGEMPDFFGQAYGQIFAKLERDQIAPAGMPFGRYRGMPTETVDVEAGVPISMPVSSEGAVAAGVLPATRAVEALHVGPYDTLVETYSEMAEWMTEQGLQPSDDMWEFYLTDPSEEPDSAKWQTKVVWPVA